MNVYGISQHNGSQISDLELDHVVCEITALFPRIVEKSVSGRLRSKGIFIQHERVRESFERVDPVLVRSCCQKNFTWKRVSNATFNFTVAY